jgi:hypothetical protein
MQSSGKHDDPDAALTRVRAYIDFLGTAKANDIRASHVFKFAADFQYLDEHISKGGALPSQWSELWAEPIDNFEFGGM